MKKGRIKTLVEGRRFGFITPDETAPDLFFYCDVVEPNGNAPVIGACVEYEDGPGRKPGERRATRVVVLGPAPGDSLPTPASSSPTGTGRVAGGGLPPECLFKSFYDENGQLDLRLFFEAPKAAAQAFHAAGLKSTQFRQFYQGFLAFAGPLRDHRMNFATARERFGVFYCERAVRQAERKVLPGVVKQLIDVHREVALREEREMLALFRYITNIYCFFGDSDKN